MKLPDPTTGYSSKLMPISISITTEIDARETFVATI
jgi:hypothetical protein